MHIKIVVSNLGWGKGFGTVWTQNLAQKILMTLIRFCWLYTIFDNNQTIKTCQFHQFYTCNFLSQTGKSQAKNHQYSQ